MARPRKDAALPDARARMIEAFWDLLEERSLEEITVGMVVAEANCNRGSFYYHFDGVNDLLDAALDIDLTSEGNLPGRLFILATGAGRISYLFKKQSSSVRHVALLMARGGYGLVYDRIVSYMELMWERVLCDDDAEEGLTDESRFVIAYTTGALLSLIQRYDNAINDATTLEDMFLAEAGGITVRNLASAQGMTFDDALTRLRGMKTVARMEHSQKSR